MAALRSRERISAEKPIPVDSLRAWMIFSRPAKAPPHDEQDVLGVDLQELLLRVLAPALRRHRGDGALDQLEQGLLHAFAGDIAGDRGVLALARDLVDLVDVDDAGLRLLDVVVALLQQLLDDVLDILAHVTGFGQRGRVGDRERHVEQARQGLGQQGLARAGGADQQDVGLGQLDLFLALPGLEPLVVVVDRDREGLLGARLADHVLVEHVHDLARLGEVAARGGGLLLEFLADDVVAELDALVANEDRWARDELADLVLALAAEGAVEDLAAIAAPALPVFAHAPVALDATCRPARPAWLRFREYHRVRRRPDGPPGPGSGPDRRGQNRDGRGPQPARTVSSGRLSRTESTSP